MRLFPELTMAALVAGVGLGLWLNPSLPSALPLLMLGLAALAVGIALRSLRLPVGPVIITTVLLLGVWRGVSASPPSLPIVPTGPVENLQVEITDAPTGSGSRFRFRGRVVTAADSGGSVPSGTNLLVYALPPDELVAERGWPFLRYGDTLLISGQLERPEPIGDFDYAAWLESQQISAILWSRQADLVGVGGGNQISSVLHRIRSRLASGLQRSIPAPQSGLAQALLLGIRSELPQSLKDAFRTAGMSHLLAISGLHVGIVMALTLAAASATVGRGNPVAVMLTMLVVWSYATLSGFDPPVVRAAIMGSLVVVQTLAGRGMRGLTALLLAAGIMVCVSPALLHSLSFQLSFTAMAGVVVALPVITMLTAALTAPLAGSGSWPARWGQYGMALLIASIVISTTTTLATVPLVALHFGEIPVMSVPATVLAMPALPAALLGGAATSLAALIAPPVGMVLGTLTWAPLAWLIWVADAMPPLLWPAHWLTTVVVAVWYAALGILTLLMSSRWVRRAASGWRRRRWRPAGAAALLAAAAPVSAITVLMLLGQLSSARPDGQLHLYLLDVGQGDAILLVTPDGHQMLVDGGPDPSKTLTALGALLPAGDRALDVVMATHFDSDHVGGLIEVLDRYDPGIVLQSIHVSDSVLYPQWRSVLEAHEHPTATVSAGHLIALGDDVMLEILYPPAGGPPATVERTANNLSAVMRVSYGSVSFLLTGDMEQDAETYLVATAGPSLRSDVLKVGHHGSKSSTSPSFLRAVNPRSAAISAGRENRYGHPHPDVLSMLESVIGEEGVFVTSTDGTIEYISDGVGLWANTSDHER